MEIAHGAQPQAAHARRADPGDVPAETAEVDALIKSLAGGVTVLLIEHDIELVMSISDHVIVMHQGGKLSKGARCGAGKRRRAQAYLGADHAVA